MALPLPRNDSNLFVYLLAPVYWGKIRNFVVNDMFYKPKNLLKNHQGSTVIILTVFVLAAVLIVSLLAADIVKNGLLMSRTQVHSAKALFAAETGIEKTLKDIWQNGIKPDCRGGDPDKGYICFDAQVDGEIDLSAPYDQICGSDCSAMGGKVSEQDIPANNTSFYIEYEYETDGTYSTTTITSTGSYMEVNRVVETEWN